MSDRQKLRFVFLIVAILHFLRGAHEEGGVKGHTRKGGQGAHEVGASRGTLSRGSRGT